MTIRCYVDFDDECWEEHIYAKTEHVNEPAALLVLMSTKTVLWVAMVRDVEAVANQFCLGVEQDNVGFLTYNWGKRVVPHSYPPTQDWGVQGLGAYD
jgi:hypothetical protein